MRSSEDVYRRFIDFEEQAAAIYLKMASRFSPENPEVSSVWLDMGIQEKQHAGLLQFCLAEQLFADELPSDQQILRAEQLFPPTGETSSGAGLGVQQAFEIAIQMETSEVNDIYNGLTSPLHASMYLLRRKIATSLPDHVGNLLREARRFKVPEETVGKLEGLVSSQ